MANGYNLNGRTAFYVAIISAVLCSISGPILLVKFGGDSMVAPDRFTGTQADALIKRVDHIEENIDSHRNNHPDKMNQYDRRIAVLESQYSTILENQRRILDRLDGR